MPTATDLHHKRGRLHVPGGGRWSDLHPSCSRPLSRKVSILGCEHYVKVRGDRDSWVASAPQKELSLHLDTIARAPADQQQRSIMLLFDGER